MEKKANEKPINLFYANEGREKKNVFFLCNLKKNDMQIFYPNLSLASFLSNNLNVNLLILIAKRGWHFL